MKKTFLLACAALAINSTFSQTIDKEYIDKAKAIREKNKDEKVVVNYSEDYFTFEKIKDKDGNPAVAAYATSNEEYMALAEGASLIAAEGYNEKVTIDKMNATYSYGGKFKNAGLFTNDREYSDDNIFDSDSRMKYMMVPLQTTGCRYNIEVEKTIHDVRYLTSNYFLSGYPILERKIFYEVPSWLQVEIREFNFEGYDIKKEVKQEKGNTIYSYTIANTKGLESERFTPSYNRIYPHVVFIPKSWTNNGKEEKLFEKVDDLYAYYKSIVAQVQNDTAYLRPIVNKLISDKKDDISKVKALYYWVQDNIKYIAFERGIAGFKPESADRVCKNKFGDCKGMANLLTNMLTLAGFDARLTWIGTTDIPYDYSLPSLIVDNHMICALKLNGKFYFLDGTESYIAFDDYALRIQGKEALIADGDKFILQKVPTLSKDRNTYEEIKKLTISGDQLTGTVVKKYKGEMQTNFLRFANDVSKADKEEVMVRVLSDNDKNFEISNIGNTDFQERDKPIDLKYNVTIKNAITDVAPELYIKLDFSNNLEGLLPDEKRKNPIEVDSRNVNKYTTELAIPAGYKVKYLPAPVSVKTPNYSFELSYTQAGNKITMSKTVTHESFLVKTSDLKAFRDDIKKIKEANGEQVILSK